MPSTGRRFALRAAQAQAMRAAFGPVWRYVHDMGMKVHSQTDMLALSPPLKRYVGEIDTSSPRPVVDAPGRGRTS
jgi:hypothetical protein